MTVYVVQKPKPGPNLVTYDISPAQEYGDIQFVFDAYENPSSNPAYSLQKVRAVLAAFDPKLDHIVSAGGDPYGLFLVGFVLNELKLPLRWLRFERLRFRPGTIPEQGAKTGYYIPVEMPSSAYIV